MFIIIHSDMKTNKFSRETFHGMFDTIINFIQVGTRSPYKGGGGGRAGYRSELGIYKNCLFRQSQRVGNKFRVKL